MFSRIYIHIPWCLEKCKYCGFYSTRGDSVDADHTAGKILREMSLCARQFEGGPIDSIYFGGGTPSLLSPESAREIIHQAFHLWGAGADGEITLEANPGTISQGSVEAFADAGINRISLGIQSFDDRSQSGLGRIHNSDMAREAFSLSRQVPGIKSLSIDMICGLPGQTMDDWRYEIDSIIALKPDHISLYALSIEQGSRFSVIYSTPESLSMLPDSDMVADMLEHAATFLCAAGYEHYEISSFAMPGHRSSHNCGYWKREGYLGLGPSAHSLILRDYGLRFANPSDTAAWSEKLSSGELAHQYFENLDMDSSLSEHIFLGLRMSDGVSEPEIRNQFGDDQWQRHELVMQYFTENGLMINRNGRYSLSHRGMMVSNQILARFI